MRPSAGQHPRPRHPRPDRVGLGLLRDRDVPAAGPAALRRDGPRAALRSAPAGLPPAAAARHLVVAGARARHPQHRRLLRPDLHRGVPPARRDRRDADRDRADHGDAGRLGADRRAAARSGSLVGAAVGAAGVALLVLRAGFAVDPVGVAASFGAVAMSSVGFVLVKRWKPPVDLLTFTAWQLVAGGLVLLPIALIVEGAPPGLDARRDRRLPLPRAGRHGRSRTSSGSAACASCPPAPCRWSACSTRSPGTVIGVALAGESFGGGQAVGLLLVLAGILRANPRWRHGSAGGGAQPATVTRTTPTSAWCRCRPRGTG